MLAPCPRRCMDCAHCAEEFTDISDFSEDSKELAAIFRQQRTSRLARATRRPRARRRPTRQLPTRYGRSPWDSSSEDDLATSRVSSSNTSSCSSSSAANQNWGGATRSPDSPRSLSLSDSDQEAVVTQEVAVTQDAADWDAWQEELVVIWRLAYDGTWNACTCTASGLGRGWRCSRRCDSGWEHWCTSAICNPDFGAHFSRGLWLFTRVYGEWRYLSCGSRQSYVEYILTATACEEHPDDTINLVD